MTTEDALKWAFESDWGTDWTKDCQAMVQLAEEVQRLTNEARRFYQADGSFTTLDNPQQVMQLRIIAAGENKRLRAEVERLTGHIDLMADEFKRIKAVHYGNTSHNLEVQQLCERAITNTKQRVPVIEQRDKAEKKAECIELALAPLIDLSQNYNGQSGSECLSIIRTVLAEAVRNEGQGQRVLYRC